MPLTPETPRPGAVLRTLLVSDLIESTRLVEELGDTAAAELLRSHDRLARDLMADQNGREIDKTDGFLLLFERPIEAVLYALEYHRALRRISQEQGRDIAARVGIHLGEIVLYENSQEDVERGAKLLEVEGLAKPTTARLMSLAEGGQTLMTRGAFDVARRAAVGVYVAEQLHWLAHGAYRFGGVLEPVEVFEVGPESLAPLAPPVDSEKARRVEEQPTITGWRPAPGVSIPHRCHWRVEEKLGEGGFGEVWLASHQKTGDRRVYKFCYDLDRLRTLQREITLFRLLKEELGEREDIARILDWNFDEAPYFIESEYTVAGSLTQWLEAHGGCRQVPLETRLEIAAQVATALAAAHSVGVLHKDVKASNVLIHTGADGAVKAQLADFGVGHVIERERLAEVGITVLGLTERAEDSTGSSMSGTRLYMAPELLEGRPATIQADIYALGVLLYQLVVGDFGRSIAPGWRRDIEDDILIEDIACFLDRSPARRPASAQEVAQRLRRLETRRAEREAVASARRALERSQHRRRLFIGIVAVTVLVLASASVLAAWARKARRAEEQARHSAQVLTFLVKLIEFTDLDELREELMVLKDEPNLHSEMATTLAEVHRKLGRRKTAMGLLHDSLEIWRRHHPEDLAGQADRINNLAVSYLAEGNLDNAERLLREGLALRDQLSDESGARVFSLNNLATILLQRGRYAESEELYRRGLEIRRNLPGSDEDTHVSSSLRSLGAVLLARGDLAAAEPLLREALEIRMREYEDGDTRATSVLDLLGRVRFARGDPWEAEQLYRRAREIRRQRHGEDHVDVLWIDRHLAVLLLAEAELPTARVVIERVYNGLRHALPEGHWRIAAADVALGALMTAEGRYAESEPCLTEGYELLWTLRGEHSSYTREARRRVFELYDAWGRPEKANAFKLPAAAPVPLAVAGSVLP